MRIGIVDVDTSHPQNWIPIERELGHEVVGIWDAGAVHPADYVKNFAAEHKVPTVFDRLEDMVGEVDCAIIHGCDWDTHVGKARPFIEAGKSVLIDKPMAGNLRDLRQFVEWEKAGARITGGSSLRFCYEVKDYNAQDVEKRGTPHTTLAGCAVDEFNYGIHAYSMLFGLMGGGAMSVRHLGQSVQRRIQINWADGRIGFVIVGAAAGWIPFYATVTTEKSCTQIVADNSKLYRALLESALPYLAGETDTPPIKMSQLIEPELCAIAARQSWMQANAEVALSELLPVDAGYDGATFAVGYRAQRYPNAK